MEYRGKSGELKKTVTLTKRQKAILTGTLLGDGYLQKTGLKNARLRLEHGGKQKEYLLWKGRQFPKLFLANPTYIERIHPKTNQTYTYWRWQSNATPVLGEWRTIFYKEGKKEIPSTLSTLLRDPLSLSVWYMDDGYYDVLQKHSFIYLGRVTRAEAEYARGAIVENFGITPRIYDKKEKGFALFFSVKETRLLHLLIKPYVIAEMNYKLSLTP